jgi:hypothetical protein
LAKSIKLLRDMRASRRCKGKGKADKRVIWVCQQGIVAAKSQKKPSSSHQPHSPND